MKKIFCALNVLLVLAVGAGGVYYDVHGTLAVKSAVSSGFVLLGAVNMVYTLLTGAKRAYPAAMLLGLALAMGGDVTLGSGFELGAGLFALGHVMYFVSYCCLERLRKADFAVGIAIFAASAALILFGPMFRFRSAALEGVCVGYAAVISLMVGKAVVNLCAHRSAAYALIAVGSALFYFSDLMLVLRWFGGAPRLAGSLCVLMYYPAQALLAHAVFHVSGRRA